MRGLQRHTFEKSYGTFIRRREWAHFSMYTALSLPAFIFLPEKMKSARDNICWHFLWFFFFRVEYILLAHFYLNFLRHPEIFSGRFLDFFSGSFFFLEILEFLSIFWILMGKILNFFLGHFFFLGLSFAVFFFRVHFFFFGCSQDFFLGQFENFSGRILKIFSCLNFIPRVRK